jgi:hypothetical protein
MHSLRQSGFVDTAQIAQRFALSGPHVRRLLRFVYLAPDIVEAIVEGRQPRILTVKLLLRGIPLDWADHHRRGRISSKICDVSTPKFFRALTLQRSPFL